MSTNSNDNTENTKDRGSNGKYRDENGNIDLEIIKSGRRPPLLTLLRTL